MPRAIDHLVIAARDLGALSDLYRRLGFQVGVRNRHPWGTENHIVQFDGAFLELIGLGEGFAAPVATPGTYSFAGFVAQFLGKREGLAMLVMRSHDVEADRADFAQNGIGDFERFDFARKATRPDGSRVDVAFSLAFAASPALPETGFFVCQQHFPENFWNRAAQAHPNGATGIVGLAFAHEHPSVAAKFLVPFLGAQGARADGRGLSIEIDGASVDIAPRAAVAELFGARAIPPDGAPLALARVGVTDLSATEVILRDQGVPYERRGVSVVVGPGTAMGAGIVFEAN